MQRLVGPRDVLVQREQQAHSSGFDAVRWVFGGEYSRGQRVPVPVAIRTLDEQKLH